MLRQFFREHWSSLWDSSSSVSWPPVGIVVRWWKGTMNICTIYISNCHGLPVQWLQETQIDHDHDRLGLGTCLVMVALLSLPYSGCTNLMYIGLDDVHHNQSVLVSCHPCQNLNDLVNIMWLTFFFLLLMAVCKGCKKAFNNDHSLKQHWISCKPAKEMIVSLHQMQQELQRNLNLKRRISLNELQGVPEIVSIDISREYPRLIYWKFHKRLRHDCQWWNWWTWAYEWPDFQVPTTSNILWLSEMFPSTLSRFFAEFDHKYSTYTPQAICSTTIACRTTPIKHPISFTCCSASSG